MFRRKTKLGPKHLIKKSNLLLQPQTFLHNDSLSFQLLIRQCQFCNPINYFLWPNCCAMAPSGTQRLQLGCTNEECNVGMSISVCSQACPVTNYCVNNTVTVCSKSAWVAKRLRGDNHHTFAKSNFRNLETSVSSLAFAALLAPFTIYAGSINIKLEAGLNRVTLNTFSHASECVCVIVGSGENLCVVLNQRMCAGCERAAKGQEASPEDQTERGTETRGSELGKSSFIYLLYQTPYLH